MTIPPQHMSLAPTDLPIYRTFRYDGGGFSISLKDLAVEDVTLVVQIYNALKSVYDLWLYMGAQPNYPLLLQRLGMFGTADFIGKVQGVGASSYLHGRDNETMRSAIHDIRGGALTSLSGYARLLPRLENKPEYIKQAVYLARDHAKMMRNIMPDLDQAVRDADEGLKLHAIDEFVNKWAGFQFELPNKQVQVVAATEFKGYVTSRCLETSAVDRILYNYINNAARFAANDEVRFTVWPLPGTELTRWIVENDITADQKKWLQQEVNGELSQLFKGGHTRGGHGVGLNNCANFVATSFGINVDEALEGGYLGAKVVGDVYYAWFHWPSYIPQSPDEPVCDCADD